MRGPRPAGAAAATQLYAIALGGNRRHGRHGSPAAVLRAAVAALALAGLEVRARSRTRATPALGPAGRGFANAAILVATPLDPPALLALLKRTEAAFGRRRGRRWGPRVLDLDIALWSGGRWPAGLRRAAPGRLAVPHRELARRGFVLDPLVDVLSGRFGGVAPRQLRARLLRPRPCRVDLGGGHAYRRARGPLAQSVEQLTFNQ